MIVALDIASATGVAVGQAGSAPRAWVERLGTTDDERFGNALRVVDRLIREHKPSLVAIEAPVGGPRTSHLLVGLVACVRGACRARGVKVEVYPIASIRKHFIGGNVTSAPYKHLPEKLRKGAARKDAKRLVMARCAALGWPVRNDDEADACALWDFACALNSRSAQMTSLPGLFERGSK